MVYNDLSIGFRINDKFRLTFGIQNLLDIKPKRIQAVQYGSGFYDTVGRYFFSNLGITL